MAVSRDMGMELVEYKQVEGLQPCCAQAYKKGRGGHQPVSA